MALPRIIIAKQNYQLQHLLASDVMDIALQPATHYEHHLSCALGTIINDQNKPFYMTLQERYAVLLKFLSSIEDSALHVDINCDDYLDPNYENATIDMKRIESDGVTIRHLIGIEAEALELYATKNADWVLGAMVLQIGCEELPGIDPLTEKKFIINIIKSRIADLLSLDAPRYNQLVTIFRIIEQELNVLVDISYDRGIVLNKYDGGADDAPTRFRIDSAITGQLEILLSIVRRENSKI